MTGRSKRQVSTIANYDPTLTLPRTFGQLLPYVLFHGACCAIGASATAALVWLFIWPQWRVNTQFIETDGVVVNRRDVAWESALIPQVLVRYRVGESELENWNGASPTFGLDHGEVEARVRSMSVGERIAVWYDPAQPDRGPRGTRLLGPLAAVSHSGRDTGLYGIRGGKTIGGIWNWQSNRQRSAG